MPIKVDILGYKEIVQKLDKLPEEVADVAIGDVQDYLLNVLRAYPPKNYITRQQAYGNKHWFGEVDPILHTTKQQRWFFAALKSGEIDVPYRRTQALSKGWHKVRTGIFGYLVNYTAYAVHVLGERKQSRHEAMVGWQKVSQVIEERKAKINKIIDEAAKKAMRKLRL